MNHQVGRSIRFERIRKGLSQRGLGDLVGLHEMTIRRIEKGHSSPTVDTLVKVAGVLGVSIDSLLRSETAA